jgi:phage tail sheath protein FI
MAEYIKPDIYINEYDKSQYITEGPTTITGIVGSSSKGPANEVVLMTNYSDYVAIFGQDSGYLDFFARFFFKYGGNKLLVVRATDQFNFAGLTSGIDSYYQIEDTLASSDTSLDIEYVTGSGVPTVYGWPESGLVRLDYNGDTEYIIYREIDMPSAGEVISLRGCKRGINGTTPITIGTWGQAVTINVSTDKLTTTDPHGMQNGQNVRFTASTNGLFTGTDYWVINKTSYTFQVTAVNGGNIPQNLTTVLTMSPFGYTNCVASDIGKVVQNGAATHTGILRGYDNTNRLWYIDPVLGTFVPEALTIPTGTGAGTCALVGGNTNTVKRHPEPTRYVNLICPVVCGNVVSGGGSITVAFDGMKYGQFIIGKTVKFGDALNSERVVRSINTEFSESLRTQTVNFTATTPAGIDGNWACMLLDPFYGGMGTYTLPMYTNFDGWDATKYDENGYPIKGGGITDPSELPIFMNIYARSCGAWANDEIRVTVYNHNDWDSSSTVPYFKNKVNYAPTTDDELLIIVESAATGQIEEQFLCSLIPTKVDFWGKTMFITDLVNDNSKWIRVFMNPNYTCVVGGGYNSIDALTGAVTCTYVPQSIERFFLTGGTDGPSTNMSGGVYVVPQVREYKILAGYNLFANTNEVDIDLISAGGNQSLAVQANIKAICETRKDCVGILNIPWGLEVTDMVRYKNLLGSSTYSAIYANGSKVLDSFTGSLVSLPPAIQVTPLIVKTDLIRDPWYATAGYNRGMLNEVVELEQDIDNGEFETLYAAGINPCINDGSGPVVFGIKTMYTGSSAFNKLPIRRLMLKMEKDIKNSMKAFLFEPNTFDTRLRIVRTVEPYLDSIRARNGIEDYRVICDSTNNTNQTIAQGQIIVEVYVKPVFTAEYIIFNFTVTKDDISSIINNA